MAPMRSSAAALLTTLLLFCTPGPVAGQAPSLKAKPNRATPSDTIRAQQSARRRDSLFVMRAGPTARTAVPETVTASKPATDWRRIVPVYVAAAFLAGIALVMTLGFIRSMQDGGSLGIESHWGGFGSGGGGWWLSPPLSFLIGLMFSAGLLTALILRESSAPNPDGSGSAQTRAPAAPVTQPEERTTSDSSDSATPWQPAREGTE